MKSNKKLLKRTIVSIVLFVLFILLPISGNMIGAMRVNLEAIYIWGAIHSLFGVLFSIFGIFHIVYNWKTLKQYLGKR